MKTVAIPLIYEKKKLFKKVAPFIEKGYMRKIYSDENLAVFSFGEVSYLACPYIPDKTPRGLLVTAKVAEHIVTENPLYISYLLSNDAYEGKCINLSKETFENCPSIIKDLKERITDEIIDYEMENRIKQYASAEIKKCENRKAKLQAEKRPYIKKLLRFLAIAVLLIALQFTCIFTKDFRYQFDEIRQAEQFNKLSTEESVYATLECDFLTPLKSYYSQRITEHYTSEDNFSHYHTEVNSADYYLFGNSQTKQFGILSIDSLYVGEFDDICNEIDANGFYKGNLTLYGNTASISPNILPSGVDTSYTWSPGMSGKYVVHGMNDAYSSTHDYSVDALKHFSEQMFEIDYSADFGRVYLNNASPKQERIKSPINKFLDSFIMLILGLVIMMTGAIKYALEMEKIQNLIKPLKGRISCLKENEYVQV